MDDLVAAIKKLRAVCGYTQQELANRLYVSTRTVANYEAGKRRPLLLVLWHLWGLAKLERRQELCDVFRGAWADAIKGVHQAVTDEENSWIRTILVLVRNKELVPNWHKFERSALANLEGLAAYKKQGKAINTDPAELEETLAWACRQFVPRAEQKLMQLAQARSKGTGESFARVYMQVVAEQPELYRQYLEENPGLALNHPRQTERTDKTGEVETAATDRKPLARGSRKARK